MQENVKDVVGLLNKYLDSQRDIKLLEENLEREKVQLSRLGQTIKNFVKKSGDSKFVYYLFNRSDKHVVARVNMDCANDCSKLIHFTELLTEEGIYLADSLLKDKAETENPQ